MVIKQNGNFNYGYTAISEINGKHSDMLMDFGILRLGKGESEENSDEKERAYLLITGKVIFEWDDKKIEANRKSVIKENPWVLHIPSGIDVKITALEESEVAVQKTINNNNFESKLYRPNECTPAEFGKGTMQEASTRKVRTIFDSTNAPWSAMVIGEVINYPGKWSSYPPHDHPQPEIYHFRFFPQQGFGFSGLEDEAFVIKDRYSVTLEPGKTHSQVSAPGYVMYYIWVIPHLRDEKFGPDSRKFREDHKWLLDSSSKIWPDIKY